MYGARQYRTALNTLFTGKTGKGFGWSGLTISYELGYMVRDDIYSHLKLKGWTLEELLNLVDKNHSIKAFNNLEGKKNVVGYLNKKIEDIENGELVMGDDSSSRLVYGKTKGVQQSFLTKEIMNLIIVGGEVN